MKFVAISTFNVAGLELYGRRMIESYRRLWPDEVPLRVYSEGWPGEVELITSSPWLAEFKARHRARAFKDYRWDSVRFAHKVAAVCHAARGDADVLIWLDGDIVTHAPVTVAMLTDLAPKGDEWIAWLDRKGNYPECGFYMLNCRHPKHGEMIDRLEAMYTEDKLFALPEWHDCFALLTVVKEGGVGTKSLSGDAGRLTSHPLVNGPLGAFLDHLKGPRKQEGRSRSTDLRYRRTEEYWR